MLATYLVCSVMAAVLMSLSCVLPAILLAIIAGALALRTELRWVAARTPRPKLPLAPIVKG